MGTLFYRKRTGGKKNNLLNQKSKSDNILLYISYLNKKNSHIQSEQSRCCDRFTLHIAGEGVVSVTRKS